MKVHDANVVLEVNHARNYAKEVLETNEKLATYDYTSIIIEMFTKDLTNLDQGINLGQVKK